jgi:hypothetical protein
LRFGGLFYKTAFGAALWEREKAQFGHGEVPGVICRELQPVAARARLAAAYKEFMSEADPMKKNEAGKELIHAIFGRDAVAEDPLR